MDNIYGKALNDKIKEIFLRLLPKQDDLFNKHLLKQYLAKKKLDLMKKLNEILLKLILLNEDKQKELLYSKFYLWLKNTEKINCHHNAKTIQKFCKTKLDNYLRKKLQQYLDNLSKKYLCYLINNIAKIN